MNKTAISAKKVLHAIKKSRGRELPKPLAFLSPFEFFGRRRLARKLTQAFQLPGGKKVTKLAPLGLKGKQELKTLVRSERQARAARVQERLGLTPEKAKEHAKKIIPDMPNSKLGLSTGKKLLIGGSIAGAAGVGALALRNAADKRRREQSEAQAQSFEQDYPKISAVPKAPGIMSKLWAKKPKWAVPFGLGAGAGALGSGIYHGAKTPSGEEVQRIHEDARRLSAIPLPPGYMF